MYLSDWIPGQRIYGCQANLLMYVNNKSKFIYKLYLFHSTTSDITENTVE